MIKVKLAILNRVSLLGLLTKKGDATTLKILRELREELSFDQGEHDLINFKSAPDGKVMYKPDAVPDREYVFEGIREVLVEKVKTELRALEKSGTMELEYLSLYEVLIEEKEPDSLKLVEDEKEDLG